MYRLQKPTKTTIKGITAREGEPIEAKMRRILNNKEPISDGAPIVYTERKEGVKPEYDIRTDRFDIATEAMDKVHKSHKAKREERHMTDEQKESKKRADEAKKNMETEGKNEGEA